MKPANPTDFNKEKTTDIIKLIRIEPILPFPWHWTWVNEPHIKLYETERTSGAIKLNDAVNVLQDGGRK